MTTTAGMRTLVCKKTKEYKMTDESIRNIIQKMTAYCRLDNEAMTRFTNFSQLTSIRTFIHEFDILRDEIGRCYVSGAFHGCITLTNHLLERYCKYFLIMHDSGFKTIQVDLEELPNVFSTSNKKYLNKDLSDTLSTLKKFGFITKGHWKRLNGYREQFRNGFGHADSNKILKDAKGPFVSGNFNTKEISKPIEITYAEVPVFSGFAIESFAVNHALFYFGEVENLIRMTISHIQPDDFIIAYPLLVFVNKK